MSPGRPSSTTGVTQKRISSISMELFHRDEMGMKSPTKSLIAKPKVAPKASKTANIKQR
jgi:hypothetical protein